MHLHKVVECLLLAAWLDDMMEKMLTLSDPAIRSETATRVALIFLLPPLRFLLRTECRGPCCPGARHHLGGGGMLERCEDEHGFPLRSALGSGVEDKY